MQCRIGLHITY